MSEQTPAEQPLDIITQLTVRQTTKRRDTLTVQMHAAFLNLPKCHSVKTMGLECHKHESLLLKLVHILPLTKICCRDNLRTRTLVSQS